MMRIVRLDETGPPENLKIVQEQIPVPGPDDVLIKVELAGLIYGDMEARRGTYFKPTLLPFYPGREVAGHVIAIGRNVCGYAVGDRVMALVLAGRCWAEYVLAPTKSTRDLSGELAPPSDIITLLDSTPFEDALPYLINFRLAHMLFHGSSRVKEGSTILVHGGSGGMGSMVIQLARAHGCPTIATCLTDVEAEYCRVLGANDVVVVSRQDYIAEVMRITSGKGVPYSFNGVGGDTLNRDFEALAPFGELHAYGYVAGKLPFDAFRLGKTITLKTFSADNYLPTEMFKMATEAMMNWLKNMPLRGVDSIFPLAEVVEANRLLDDGKIRGKVALKP